jgi:hypothetical protein
MMACFNDGRARGRFLRMTEGLVPGIGIEPTRPCGHRILSPARLPVPPARHISENKEYHKL